jgi:uracil-DNA glycosylase
MCRDPLPELRPDTGEVLMKARGVTAALAELRANPDAGGWCRLPFFKEGEADRIAAELDGLCAAGVLLAPPPAMVFRALELTPLERVKAVILGQDPYPKAGDAHGLAFSYVGPKSVPASLRVIFRELCDDLGCPTPVGGDLTAWALQGVLLLNAALTTETGTSGAHMRLGWSALVDQVLVAVSTERPAVAFLLWGQNARSRAGLIDRAKHLVLESGHPSPLNRARDFPGSRPFSRANAWLASKGVEPVDWRL